MNMKTMSCLSVAALIVSGSPLFAASSASETPAEASRLLKEVRSIAYALNRDAATLESYRLSGITWRSHAHRLALAKEHINDIGDRLESLQAMRGSAAPWQQEAIDSIVPVAAQLASRTEAAINYLNENPGQLFVPVYTGHLSAIAGHADWMEQSVDVFLDLARAQDRLDGLRGLG
ncbi:MAG: hypothetical protein ACREJN_10445 [Nitrospiraceae bacterium]